VAAVECVEQLMTTALLPHSHRWRLHSSTYTWGAKWQWQQGEGRGDEDTETITYHIIPVNIPYHTS